MKREVFADIKREEKNMVILRHHYLTKVIKTLHCFCFFNTFLLDQLKFTPVLFSKNVLQEQVKGYRWEMGKETEFVKMKQEERRKNFPQNVCLEDRMGRLRICDSWDKYFD